MLDEEGGHLLGDESINDSVVAGGLSLEKDIRSSWRMLAPFLLLVCLISVLAFKLTAMGSQAVRSSSVVRDCGATGLYPLVVQKGDTCWDIAQRHSSSLSELSNLNPDLNCESLGIGKVVCLESPVQT